MASTRRTNSTGSKAWLLEGGKRPRRQGRRGRAAKASATDSNEWLAVPSPKNGTANKANDRATGKHSSGTKRPRQPARDKPAAPKVGSARERRLRSKLRRAKDRISSQQDEIDEMRRQLEKLQDTRKGDASANGSTAGRPANRRSTTTGRRTKVTPKPKQKQRARTNNQTPGGKLDLNRVTFEQLREFGLSVTQSARLIAHRDVRDGYGSLDDLDSLTGFPSETITELKSRLRIETR